MSEAVDWINEAAAAGRDLRAAITEAHGLLRDMRDTRREMESFHRQAIHGLHTTFERSFSETFERMRVAYEERYEATVIELQRESLAEVSRVAMGAIEEARQLVTRALERTGVES